MRAEYMPRTICRKLAVGTLGATLGLAVAMLPASAHGEVLIPHAVTPHVVSTHVVTPPPPSPPPAANPPPAPNPPPAASSAPAASQQAVAPPPPQSPAPAPSPTQRRAGGDGDGSDQQTGHDFPHLPWGWIMSGESNGIPGLDILVQWWGTGEPLFGFGSDLPIPVDGDKVTEIGLDLSFDALTISDEVNGYLLGPHQPVAIPPTAGPAGPDSSTSNEDSGSGSDSGAGGGGWTGDGSVDDGESSEGGAGGGGGMPDLANLLGAD
jgi:hypothetical protein